MSQGMEKIRYLVQNLPKQEGIRGLIKLQSQLTDNEKLKCRVACLHLMEMNHDWIGLQKLMIQWELVKYFGRQLIFRMRRRVEEQKGDLIQESDKILAQLDRLNQKSWRVYSPKKSFPNYLEQLEKRKERKIVKPLKVQPRISETIQIKSSDSKDRITLSKEGSIFSKLAELHQQKQEKNKQMMVNLKNTSGNRFQSGSLLDENSKKLLSVINQSSFEGNQNSRNKHFRNIGEEERKYDKSEVPNEKQPQKEKISSTPMKLEPHSNPWNNIDRGQLKDSFSFSAVKKVARQSQDQRLTSNKQAKNENLDNSFLNFTNQSIRKEHKQKNFERGENILKVIPDEEPFRISERRPRQNKPFLSEEKLRLVDSEGCSQNYIKMVFEMEGFSGLQILQKALKE